MAWAKVWLQTTLDHLLGAAERPWSPVLSQMWNREGFFLQTRAGNAVPPPMALGMQIMEALAS